MSVAPIIRIARNVVCAFTEEARVSKQAASRLQGMSRELLQLAELFDDLGDVETASRLGFAKLEVDAARKRMMGGPS